MPVCQGQGGGRTDSRQLPSAQPVREPSAPRHASSGNAIAPTSAALGFLVGKV